MRPYIRLNTPENRYHGRGFFVDSVNLIEIKKLNTTPVYISSLNAIQQRVKKYIGVLKSNFKNSNIFYAMKANYSLPILKEVKLAGAGVDIVSIGEWTAALNAGFHPQNICFAGVGKRQSEWQEAIQLGLGYLNVEHLTELENVLSFIYDNKLFKKKQKTKIAIRLNPVVEVNTHSYLKTGALDSKFGVLFEHFSLWLTEKKSNFKNIDKFLRWIEPLQGIHVHIGSQLMEKDKFHLTIDKVMECAAFMETLGLNICHFDLGGGLWVPESGVPADASDILEHVNFFCSSFKKAAFTFPRLMEKWREDFSLLSICLEPGRSVVASSTVFLTEVMYIKQNSANNLFCYVDGGMNDFPRPSIYGAVHQCEVVDFSSKVSPNLRDFKTQFNWNIVGPVCESGDFLAKNAQLPMLYPGDFIAFFEGGAYCRSMASNYNLRPLPSEVFVKDGEIIDIKIYPLKIE